MNYKFKLLDISNIPRIEIRYNEKAYDILLMKNLTTKATKDITKSTKGFPLSPLCFP